jgi:hypothetical protein
MNWNDERTLDEVGVGIVQNRRDLAACRSEAGRGTNSVQYAMRKLMFWSMHAMWPLVGTRVLVRQLAEL